MIDKGKFIVDEIEHRGAPDKLVIRVRSVDFRNSMNVARDHSYHDRTLGDIVNEVANRNRMGHTLAAGLAEIKITHIDQSQETDVAFLTRLATMNGAVAAIKNERLLFLFRSKHLGQTSAVTDFGTQRWRPALLQCGRSERLHRRYFQMARYSACQATADDITT